MIAKIRMLSVPVVLGSAVLLGGYLPAAASDISVSESASGQLVNITQDTPPAPPDGSTPPDGAPPAPPDGAMPNGAPRDGAPPGGAPGDMTGASTTNAVLVAGCGVYTLDAGEAASVADASYDSASGDQSAACLINGANLTLTNVSITKTGDTSSADSSSFFGLNAAVLVGSGSQLTLDGGTVMADGAGANGVFSTGEGSLVSLNDVTIDAQGDGAHAVMATLGGTLILNNVDMTTTDAHSGAIATDRGSGTITATGGSVTTSGADSPGIYSTGDITLSDATVTSTGAEVVVIEGANSVTINNSTLVSSVADKWGVMLYQSFSGDAEGTEGSFTMNGGALSDTDATSPLFYVTNAEGTITLTGVEINAASGILVQAAANERWGTGGHNGGSAIVVAAGQTLNGDLVADSMSSLSLTLQNGSALTGAVNAEHTAVAASVSLDAGSTWTLDGDSYLTGFADAGGIDGSSITNIIGNGYSIYYDASSDANSALNGQTYSLVNGGQLAPIQ